MPTSWIRVTFPLIVGMLLIVGCTPVASNPGAQPKPTPTLISRDFEVEANGGVMRGGCEGPREPGTPAVVLLSGGGNPGSQLSSIQEELKDEVLVCTYDRAGLGASDPVVGPQTFTNLVEDLDAVLVGAEIAPPYVLVGQSVGGTMALRYAQVHPEKVAGFVAMNPGPPATDYEARAALVETPEELQTNEIDPNSGKNEEGIDFRSTDLILEEPFPDSIPYVVMFAEDCSDEFCDRIRPVIAAASEDLANLGDGRFVAVEGAGHEIYLTNLEEVLTEIRSVLPAD